jgi:hypothetical protein
MNPLSALWLGIPQARAQQLDPQALAEQQMLEDQISMQQQLGPAQQIPIVSQEVSTRSQRPSSAQQSQNQRLMDLAAQYEAQQKQALSQEQLGIDQLQQDFDQAKGQPAPTNWAPLAALTDAWTGSNFQQALPYMGYESPAKRQERLLELQGKIQQRKSDLNKSQADTLKSQIEAYKAGKDSSLDEEYKKAQIGYLRAQSGAKADGKILPETSIQKISDFDASLKELNDMGQNFGQYEDTMGPVQGRIASMNPYDEKAQSFQADLDRARQVVGKAVEGGVLRKEDEEKYLKMLPSLKDNPEVGKYKMQQFMNKMSVQRNSYLGNMNKAGYNTKNVLPVQEAPHAPGPQRNRLEELRQKAGR